VQDLTSIEHFWLMQIFVILGQNKTYILSLLQLNIEGHEGYQLNES